MTDLVLNSICHALIPPKKLLIVFYPFYKHCMLSVTQLYNFIIYYLPFYLLQYAGLHYF